MSTLDIIFQVAVLIMSVVIHEVSHGYVAGMLGDPTARLAGRLTLNPLRHLEWFGSFIVPLLTSLTGFTFGWAKPVPVNTYNLRWGRKGEALVAAAGPLSNFLIALVFGIFIRLGIANSWFSGPDDPLFHISILITAINLVLVVFNLVPVPPLDGSKIAFAMLPARLFYIQEWAERNGLLLILIVVFFLWQFFEPIVNLLFNVITGLTLL